MTMMKHKIQTEAASSIRRHARAIINDHHQDDRRMVIGKMTTAIVVCGFSLFKRWTVARHA